MTDTARIESLEERVTELRVANAALATSVEHLAESVKTLTDTVGDLRDTMNKGRGALWVIVGGSSVLGAVIATVISNYFGKGS